MKQTLKQVKIKIKQSIALEIQEQWETKIKTLTMQGNMLQLMAEEKSNVTWKSIIHNMPRKVLKFGLNSVIETLPVNKNLALWGKTLNQSCALCGYKETVLHVLNGCPVMLNQGRYTYRHNIILAIILAKLCKMYTEESIKIYSDIEGRHAIGGGTIPPNILVTNEKPDIVIVNQNNIQLIELSVPFESNIAIRHEFKCNKYAMLVRDLTRCGLQVTLHAVEVGSRGYISPQNKDHFKEIFKDLSKKEITNLNQEMAQKALTSSFTIFYSKYSKEWCCSSDLSAQW